MIAPEQLTTTHHNAALSIDASRKSGPPTERNREFLMNCIDFFLFLVNLED